MARYVSPTYGFDIPDLSEDPDVSADLRTLVDRLEIVIAGVDPGFTILKGSGPPAAGLGSDGDIYFETA